MKKLIIILIAACFLLGCVGPQIQRSIDPIIVKLEIAGVDAVNVQEKADKIVRSMEIKSENGELSSITFIEGGIGYMKIWGGIGGADANYIWNDLCLMSLRGIKHVELYINSGGGSAFDGLSIADQIERFIHMGGSVFAHASGIIASATVPIFAVCSKRAALAGTIFLVHEATMFKYFTSETKSDIKAQSDMMTLLENAYLAKLATYTSLSVEDWRKMTVETTWFDTKTAQEIGLVDEVE